MLEILITNDDGFEAEGIHALAAFAKKLGRVTVVAPKVEQSGKSHAIDFKNELEIKKIDFPEADEAYYVDSTPADCVRFAVIGLKRKYDLVLSGINRGVNLGIDISYSGTAGAIFEAGRLGMRGIALSTYPDTLAEALPHLDGVYSFLTENRLFDLTPIYNVNIPPSPKGTVITKQGSPYFSDEFVHLHGDMYMQMGGKIPDVCPEDMSRDTVALEAGYISVMPLSTTRTDMKVFEKLRELGI
ncbi:MAG: 5'/3'-nucleotidase SurE [Clostridia bacterium]|nr:5'/3'-nucleotidase SurE [Clostridia bacterium]